MNKVNTPFARAKAMFAAIAAVMSMAPNDDRAMAVNKIGPYKSRGKGGKRPLRSSSHCVAQDKRAAKKARNVARHKARR